MKNIILLLLMILISCTSNKTIINTLSDGQYPFISKSEKKYKYANQDAYVQYILTEKTTEFNGKIYKIQLIAYSWKELDTAYYRAENDVIYYLDNKSKKESIHMPRELKKGFVWKSFDGAWQYEISDLNSRLKTPEKEYKELLVIKATQLQNRDKSKSMVYLNYYKKGIGKIASVTNGKIQTYLLEN